MSDIKYLSTTALARRLGKEAKELFVLLARAHWMVKVDERWQLTEKGRFEGGIYLHHPKFGDYVAWPESVVDHGIWEDLPEAPLTAGQLGQKFNLPARLLNLVLADLGWQVRGVRGWLLTEVGRGLGGQQRRADDSAVPYVTWPERLLDEADLKAMLARLHAGESLDGRGYESPNAAKVGNWLYLHGLSFAFNRSLTGAPMPVSFYLPQSQICLQLWGAPKGSGDIKDKLAQQAWLKSRKYLELEPETAVDMQSLDAQCAAGLLMLGVATY